MRVRRHHLLLAGLLLFFAGVQFRLVESFTLSERSSHFISAQLGGKGVPPPQQLWQNMPSRKVVKPPRWLGLALMSVGSVLTLKSLSMKKVA
ncbi:MAG: hypothetical protein ACKOK8_16495 [Planctomycetia bacterium]